MRWLEGSSPIGVLTGTVNNELLQTAARILLRYTRAEPGGDTEVKVTINDNDSVLTVRNEFSPEHIEEFRV